MNVHILLFTATDYWVFQLSRDDDGKLVWDLIKHALLRDNVEDLEKRFGAIYRGGLKKNLHYRQTAKRSFWFLPYEDYPL